MKFAWGPNLYGVAAQNTAQVEDIDLPDFDYQEMLVDYDDFYKWIKTLNWV